VILFFPSGAIYPSRLSAVACAPCHYNPKLTRKCLSIDLFKGADFAAGPRDITSAYFHGVSWSSPAFPSKRTLNNPLTDMTAQSELSCRSDKIVASSVGDLA